MKSAITLAPHNVEIQETAEPTVGPGEALIRVEWVGICGSDVHFYPGAHPYASHPRIQGHEASGKIVEFGEGYSGDLAGTVRDWTNGEGAHVAIDDVGAPPVIRKCEELVASAGRVAIVGLSMQEVSLPAALKLATEHLDQVEKVMIEVWNGESA